jgi:rubrerythrin
LFLEKGWVILAKRDKIQQIIGHIAGVASVAAGGVSEAVQSAGTVVSHKYDALKLNAEMARLREEQRNIFTEVGRAMFLVQSGGDSDVAQQSIDELLLQAEQLEAGMKDVPEKLYALSGEQVCPVCGHVCKADDIFCSACGAKLPEKP